MEKINNFSSINSINFNNTIGINTEDNKTNDDVFKNMYDAFIDIYDNTNAAQVNASNLQLDFATGKTDDMLSVMLAQEEAYTSLNFAVQVTNKVIASYKEIMSIQL